MWHILVYTFLFHHFNTISSSMHSVPVIHNVSLQMLNYNSTIMNGSCNDCLCAMFANATPIYAFNCFQNNKTCEIFSKSLETNSFSLMDNSASSVYFITLPVNQPILATTVVAQSTGSFESKSLLL
jgi:hypothetical protein